MKVKVRFFASFREKVEKDYGEYEFDDSPTVRDLQKEIEKQYPEIFGKSRVMISINYRYAEPDDRIKEGDEVAVMPLASGG